MLVLRRVALSIKFAGKHLTTWVERDTVRVKFLFQDRNTMSPARARTKTARSVVERTSMSPPRLMVKFDLNASELREPKAQTREK